MKEKLIALVKACASDNEMLTANPYDNWNNRIGIIVNKNERDSLSSHYYFGYKGNTWSRDTGVKFEHPNNDNYLDRYNIELYFKNEPSIIIEGKRIEIARNESTIIGKKHRIFSATINVTRVVYAMEYNLSCGRYKYPIDVETIDSLYQLFQNARIALANKKEDAELATRFAKYKIK